MLKCFVLVKEEDCYRIQRAVVEKETYPGTQNSSTHAKLGQRNAQDGLQLIGISHMPRCSLLSSPAVHSL